MLRVRNIHNKALGYNKLLFNLVFVGGNPMTR